MLEEREHVALTIMTSVTLRNFIAGCVNSAVIRRDIMVLARKYKDTRLRK